MKIKILAAAVALTALYSCSESKKPESAGSTAPLKTGEASIKGCYLYTVNRDTFQLAITSKDEKVVEGNLIYNFFEKDDSRGTFTGAYENGILTVDYRFQAEGKSSVRQVIFKKTTDGFVEGTGEIKNEDGKEIFANPSSVSYEGGLNYQHSETCLP